MAGDGGRVGLVLYYRYIQWVKIVLHQPSILPPLSVLHGSELHIFVHLYMQLTFRVRYN